MEKTAMTENSETVSVDTEDVPIQETLIRGEDFRLVYANAAKVGSTSFDVHLTFSLLAEVSHNNAGIRELVTVVVPPQVAQSLAFLIANKLEAMQSLQKQKEVPAETVQAITNGSTETAASKQRKKH